MSHLAWKPLPQNPVYLVSAQGDIINTSTGRVLKPNLRDGYKRVHYRSMDGKWANIYNHRAVLFAFVGKPTDIRHEAGHFNGNCLDNRVENLRWCTPIENAADRIAHGTQPRGERHGRAKMSDLEIKRMRLDRANGATVRSLAKTCGVAHSTISTILSGRFRRPTASDAPVCIEGVGTCPKSVGRLA